MQTSRLSWYGWVGMNLVLVAFLGMSHYFGSPKEIYIYSFLVFCSLYLVAVLAFTNEELYCLCSIALLYKISLCCVGLHACVPQKWLSCLFIIPMCCGFDAPILLPPSVCICMYYWPWTSMGFIFCMLVTIELLVLGCLLNYPFGWLWLVGLEGKFQMDHHASKSQPTTLLYIAFMAKSL